MTHRRISFFGDFLDQAEDSRHAGETSQLEEHESTLGMFHSSNKAQWKTAEHHPS